MIILGVDPGLTNTGWGVVERVGSRTTCVAYGCIVTDPAEETPRRLKAVYDELTRVIEVHQPEECGVETLFFNANVRTAFSTGQARGAVLLAAAQAGLPVGEYGPSEMKLAVVGTGSADKRQVQYMVRSILGLAEDPRPDHAADALALAICHANSTALRRRTGSGPTAPASATRGFEAAVERAERREAARRGTEAGR